MEKHSTVGPSTPSATLTALTRVLITLGFRGKLFLIICKGPKDIKQGYACCFRNLRAREKRERERERDRCVPSFNVVEFALL